MMRLLISSFALGAAGAALPVPVIYEAARAFAPVVALFATSIFPCMTLAVGAMKAEGRSPQLVNDLHQRLKSLLSVLIATFGLAGAAVALCMVAVALAEKDAPVLPVVQFYAAKGVAALIGVITAILVGRIYAVCRAYGFILDVNHKQAQLMAREKSKAEQDLAIQAIKMPPAKPVTARPLSKMVS